MDFWGRLDQLIDTCTVVIDRPRDSRHPRYPDLIYPLDYGYLDGTTGGDGQGLDVWRGSLTEPALGAVVCTVDAVKRDGELKLLLGCTAEERGIVMAFYQQVDFMSALLIERPRE